MCCISHGKKQNLMYIYNCNEATNFKGAYNTTSPFAFHIFREVQKYDDVLWVVNGLRQHFTVVERRNEHEE